MLTVNAIEAGMPLVDLLQQNSIQLQPVLGSPLQRLVTATNIEPNMLSTSNGEISMNSRLMSELTNQSDPVTGYSEHCQIMEESKRVAVPGILAQIAYATNEGAGAVEDLAQAVTASIDSIGPMAETGAQIIVRTVAPPLMNESFLEAVMASKDAPVFKVRLDMRLPSWTADQIRALMRTGAQALDKVISEYFADWSDQEIEHLWNNVYTESNPLTDTTLNNYISGPKHVKEAVFIFLTARRLAEKIIDDVNMTESAYLSLTSDFRNQAARQLCISIEDHVADEKNNRLIYSVEGLTVTVNKVPYDKWKTSGGTAEGILGAVLTEPNAVTLDKLIEGRPVYEAAWRRQYMLNEQTYANRRFNRIKEALIVEYSHQTTTATYEDFPASERAVSHELFCREVELLTIHDTDDINMTCLRLLGRSRYRGKSVYDILSGVAYVRKKNPKASAQEAASVAIIEYVSRWVASQMVVVRGS